MRKSLSVMVTLGLLGWVGVEQAPAQVVRRGPVTVYTVPNNQLQSATTIDIGSAKPMPLPSAPSRSATKAQADLLDVMAGGGGVHGAPGYSPGQAGSGPLPEEQVLLGASDVEDDADEVTPEEFGTSNHPFSTARADLSPQATNTSYPYRASGKLFFNVTPGAPPTAKPNSWCSASLIKRGVVVTAAHCVADFGASTFYRNWQFIPGYRNNGGLSTWTVRTAIVMTSYFNGTDPCAVVGIVCQDDVAVLLLNPHGKVYPGTSLGWYGYGWNGYGFVSGLTQITQIGYPACLDNGKLMQRNDSYGYTSAGNSNNTIIGSLMCGGSSGGPWTVNFGIRPALTGTTAGAAPDPNIVVGVTSWGYISSLPKEQGASPFTSGNIVPLVNAACGMVPAACA